MNAPVEKVVCRVTTADLDEVEVRVDEEREEDGLEFWSVNVEGLQEPSSGQDRSRLDRRARLRRKTVVPVLTFSTNALIPSYPFSQLGGSTSIWPGATLWSILLRCCPCCPAAPALPALGALGAFLSVKSSNPTALPPPAAAVAGLAGLLPPAPPAAPSRSAWSATAALWWPRLAR